MVFSAYIFHFSAIFLSNSSLPVLSRVLTFHMLNVTPLPSLSWFDDVRNLLDDGLEHVQFPAWHDPHGLKLRDPLMSFTLFLVRTVMLNHQVSRSFFHSGARVLSMPTHSSPLNGPCLLGRLSCALAPTESPREDGMTDSWISRGLGETTDAVFHILGKFVQKLMLPHSAISVTFLHNSVK